MCDCSCEVLPSQDCCPDFRLYPAVHMQALVVGEVGRHSWEQSPLLLLHRLIPAKGKGEDQCKTRRNLVLNPPQDSSEFNINRLSNSSK